MTQHIVTGQYTIYDSSVSNCSIIRISIRSISQSIDFVIITICILLWILSGKLFPVYYHMELELFFHDIMYRELVGIIKDWGWVFQSCYLNRPLVIPPQNQRYNDSFWINIVGCLWLWSSSQLSFLKQLSIRHFQRLLLVPDIISKMLRYCLPKRMKEMPGSLVFNYADILFNENCSVLILVHGDVMYFIMIWIEEISECWISKRSFCL